MESGLRVSGWRVDEKWMEVDGEWIKGGGAIPAMMCMLCFLAR